MSVLTLHMVEDDTAPVREFTIERDDGTIVDLTTATNVKAVIYDSVNFATTNTGHQSCTIEDAINGVVSYRFHAGDITDPVVYFMDLVITYASGDVETNPQYIDIQVRPKAGTVS